MNISDVSDVHNEIAELMKEKDFAQWRQRDIKHDIQAFKFMFWLIYKDTKASYTGTKIGKETLNSVLSYLHSTVVEYVEYRTKVENYQKIIDEKDLALHEMMFGKVSPK